MKNPKTILITGASSGIGRAVAEHYAGAGITLLLTGRDTARLAEVQSLCQRKGATVKTSTVNVTDEQGLAEQILNWDDQSPIDLVIANAGISGGGSTVTDATPREKGLTDKAASASFRDIMTTNLDGTFNTVQPLIPRMKQRKRGQIALMSSMAGWRGMPNAPAYSTSKVAVRAWGEALRPLLKPDGIHVSVIFPGFIKTPLTDVNKFPMPFLMTTEKAAKAIVNGLAHNKARICFPLRMMILARFMAALPLCIGDFILSRAPQKD